MPKPNKEMTLFFCHLILSNARLLPIDRLILAYIASFTGVELFVAKNRTIARYFNCSASTVSKSVNRLLRYKLIEDNLVVKGRYTIRAAKESLCRGYIDKLKSDLEKSGDPKRSEIRKLKLAIAVEEINNDAKLYSRNLFFSEALLRDPRLLANDRLILAFVANLHKNGTGCVAKNMTCNS